MKLIRNLYFLLLTFVMVSCSLGYDGETKMIVRGKVTNSAVEDLSSVSVSIRANGNNGDSNTIGNCITDASGNFTMVFPKATDATYELIVNDSYLPDYQIKHFLNLENDDFIDYKFDFETIPLYRIDDICSVQIELNRVNPNNVIEFIDLVGIETVDYIYFHNFFDGPSYDTFYAESMRKNQTIQLHYSVYNLQTNTSTQYQIPLTISNEDVFFHTIEY